jgi:hypothetical protein
MFKDTQCEAWKKQMGGPTATNFQQLYMALACSLHSLLSTQVIIITNTMYCYLKTLYVLHVYMLMYYNIKNVFIVKICDI